jgi:putative flavoprotein involved in K+ transport
MRDVLDAGVERVPRVTGASAGLPVLRNGQEMEVANIIWCTGFCPDFSWIGPAVIGPDGMPEHDRGIARAEPGLSFVGLPFQSRFTSAFIGGVGADAAHVVEHVGTRPRLARTAGADPAALSRSAADGDAAAAAR